ncbi:hypothetical protein CMK18_22770 [Candidatus Poribacteria bacterium]|nr:hypothetical protein [Candidatus Poribacteria bacterium]|tara:strand:- start:757 stop:954 length:198 start_codon:yes stop_codon:yes gene_type:complete
MVHNYLMTRQTPREPVEGDLTRFTRVPGFQEDGAKIQGAETLDKNDPDYILKFAALAGIDIEYKN